MGSSPDLDRFLDDLLASGDVSAAAALVATSERTVAIAAAGVEPEARFDLGSLTKPFTASLALVLEENGSLPLELTVGAVFPEAHPALARRKLSDLLRHQAGMRPWHPLYASAQDREQALDLLLGLELSDPAALGVYSDLDYILWGLAAEEVTGRSLGDLLHADLLSHLGLEAVEASPGEGPNLAPCRLDNGREQELAAGLGITIEAFAAPPPGVVQDGNGRFFGGLAGHAGLFGTVHHLAALAREWLRPNRILEEELVGEALSPIGAFYLGWYRAHRGGSAGPSLPASAFGHPGFPGGSLWIDPEAEEIFVLLSHKTRSDVDLTSWRQRFHTLARRLD